MYSTTGFRALAAVATCLVATTTNASESRGEVCERLWRRESAKSAKSLLGGEAPGWEHLVATWLSHRQQCAGTIAWEARLAIACVAAGRPDQARKVLAPIQGLASEYAYLVDLALLQFEYFGLAQGSAKKERLEAVAKQFRAYTRKYPDAAEGHAQLGALQTLLGKHEDAVESLSRALKSDTDLTGVHRNLTISYSALGLYPDAVRAADEAVDLSPELLTDPEFVYAGARALAGVGKVDAAMNVLNLFATKRPERRNDSGLWEAVEFVKARKAAANR